MTTPAALPPVADEGLRCLSCDYNMTGLTSDRCPECGTVIDWPTVRAVRDGLDDRPGTCWEGWPWYLKPIAFFVTAFHAALMPWVLARQLRDRPRILPVVVFGVVCLASDAVMWRFVHGEGPVVPLVLGITSQMVQQTLLFWLVLPVTRSRRRSLRFWMAVTAYTSWPVLIEGFAYAPPPIILWRESDVWPFPNGGFIGANVPTSVLFYIWWLDLAIIASVRVGRRFWLRIVLAVLAIPVLVYVSTVLAVLAA